MGVDGFVRCECFARRATTPPPFPWESLYINEDGHLSLRPEFNSDEEWQLRYSWEQACCEHKDMRIASEHISNWGGYRALQEALDAAGWDNFPTLKQQLPTTNGGMTTCAASEAALAELALFRELPVIGTNAYVVDDAGNPLFPHIRAYKSVFIHCGRSGVEAGVDSHGFFVRRVTFPSELFRGVKVKQSLLDPYDPARRYDGRAKLRDLETGETYVGQIVVGVRETMTPEGTLQYLVPERFSVETRDVIASDFEYILGALTRLFEASLATGNPVFWC